MFPWPRRGSRHWHLRPWASLLEPRIGAYRGGRWRDSYDFCPNMVLTLWLCQNSYWKWPFILDFPIKNGGSFHSYVKLPEGMLFLIWRNSRYLSILDPGWWLTYPSEKYESVGIMKLPTESNNKIHLPNHQPASNLAGQFPISLRWFSSHVWWQRAFP